MTATCEPLPCGRPARPGGPESADPEGASSVSWEEPAADGESSWWAAADAAVQEASATHLALHRARPAPGGRSPGGRTGRRQPTRTPGAVPGRPHVGGAGRADRARRRPPPNSAPHSAPCWTHRRWRPVDRPRIAVTDALTGALLVLTDAPGCARPAACGSPACRTGTARVRSRPDRPARARTAGGVLDLSARRGPGPARPGARPPMPLSRLPAPRAPRRRTRPQPSPGPTAPPPSGTSPASAPTDHRGKHQAPGWTDYLRRTEP